MLVRHRHNHACMLAIRVQVHLGHQLVFVRSERSNLTFWLEGLDINPDSTVDWDELLSMASCRHTIPYFC